MRKLFNKIKAKVNVIDLLMYLTLFQALLVSMPFIWRQFARLVGPEGGVKVGDLVWNVAFDFLVIDIVLVVFVLLLKALRKADRWLERKN